MKIYQDLEEAIAKGTTGKFIRDAVREHQSSKYSGFYITVVPEELGRRKED